MSSDRVISLRNRAVRVALSIIPSTVSSQDHLPHPPRSTPSSSMTDQNPLPDRDPPVPDHSEFEARFARLERMLQDLALRPTISPPIAPIVDHSLPPPLAYMEPLLEVRIKRFTSSLSVDTYRLRERTTAIRPGQVSSLSSTAAVIRPRLEGSFP